MLGIHDPSIYLGYLFAILSTVACIWYGVKNWNKGSEPEISEIQKDIEWETKDEKINEQF